MAAAFDFHADSAHGNESYGVNRSSAEYEIGDCAHCHDTFNDTTCGENQFMLFVPLYTSQSNNVCLWCHIEPESQFQQQIDMPQQWPLARKFGGATPIACPDNIRNAFMFIDEAGNPRSDHCYVSTGSAHHLPTVRSFLQNIAPDEWGFGNILDNINPCEACHNPHKAQRHNYPVDSKGTSPISLPSTHGGTWDVYGAKTTERMDRYSSAYYQAPYCWESISTYEPCGQTYSGPSDGSNMPDIAWLCYTCHNPEPEFDCQIVSDQRNTFTGSYLSIYIRNPNYVTSPHGLLDPPSSDSQSRKPPYNVNRNYILACTDCHEPHGSRNRMLIRRQVNGGDIADVVTFTDWRDRSHWISLCQRCHTKDFNTHAAGSNCYMCHMHYHNAYKPF